MKINKEIIVFDFLLPLTILVVILLGIFYLVRWEKRVDEKQIEINKVGTQINYGAWKP